MSDSSSKICKIIKCDDHMLTLSQKLRTFYKEKEFYDVTLVAAVDNVKMEAHRLVLSASSDYFRAMFRSTLKEATSEEVKLDNMDGTTLKLLLDFIYLASIKLRSDTVESILRAAHLYELKTLIPVCCNFMEEQLDISNCLGIAYLAEQLGCTALFTKALAFACKHYEKVCKEKEFFKLNEEQLKKLLSSNDIRVKSKDNVFNSVIAWVEHDQSSREKLMFTLMSQVRTIEFSKPSLESLSLLPIDCIKPKRTPKLVFAYDTELVDDFTVQSYNREINMWSYESWPKQIYTRSQYSATVLKNTLFIAGGTINGAPTSAVECLDLKTMKWANMPKMAYIRCCPAAAAMGEILYVVSGTCSSDPFWCIESCGFAKDEKWKKFNTKGAGNSPVKVVALNGLLYVATQNRAYLDCFDPYRESLTRLSMSIDIVNFGMAALGGYLYIVGGQDKLGETSGYAQRYDPSKKSWVTIKPMGFRRSHVNCSTLNNRLIACGGLDSFGRELNAVEEYNPETDTWMTLAPLLLHKFKMLPFPLFTV